MGLFLGDMSGLDWFQNRIIDELKDNMIDRIKRHIEYYKRGKKFVNDPIDQEYFNFGKEYLNDSKYLEVREKDKFELQKTPTRTEIINFLFSKRDFNSTVYLEIGVRNPDDNFNKVNSKLKYSVDPGLEFEANPVDFKVTSDEFFEKLGRGEFLTQETKFDIIFIDGLHLAVQVDRDIFNSLKYLKEDGFIVLHDCNPPSEWHAREDFLCKLTPSGGNWNGTVWKAFSKWRKDEKISMCCVDTDWGVGVISKSLSFGESLKIHNEFFEYIWFNKNRKLVLNLIEFKQFTSFFHKSKL